MRAGHISICIFAWLLVLACFTPQLKADPLRIYIVTDLEGASGVYKFTQTREPGHPLGETAKEYLMGDIAAVVRGLRSAQVTDIVILDGPRVPGLCPAPDGAGRHLHHWQTPSGAPHRP